MLLFASLLLSACSRHNPPPPEVKLASPLEDVQTHLAEAPGAELFRTQCQTCHSLRYIEMQPAFPRKTWVKIVDKMVKTFGAQIPDTTQQIAIVDYLMAVRGKEEEAAH